MRMRHYNTMAWLGMLLVVYLFVTTPINVRLEFTFHFESGEYIETIEEPSLYDEVFGDQCARLGYVK